MVVSQSVFNALMKQDPKVVEELVRANNMGEVSKSSRNQIKQVLDRSEGKMMNGLPMVELSREGMNKLRQDREERQREQLEKVSRADRTRNFVFGRDMNLDGSFAANLDAEMSRASRMGAPRSEARARVVSSVLDFHRIYRNSTDAEKALGTARESIATPQIVPDRKNEVAEPLHETINFSKFAKWNDRADDERRREEERRLEEERISRDERTIEDEMPFFERMLTR